MATWMMRAGLALVVMAAAAASFGAAGEEAKVSGDLKTMQGAWVNDTEGDREARFVFDGETVKSTVNGQEYTSTVKLDPKAEPHPTIDFAVNDGPEDSKGKTAKGIYKLDGDKLTICVSMPGAETRPAELKDVPEEAFLFKLRRDADK